ncbi:thiol:disulfide interchange protein DsbA/DsbL [Pseudoxanthomonas sp.]|uniref:thiol:disulfide interchange protein DsbA/DsbL n=1 Tax=Pseudoxanthomonas sp. TaxID=1871049 RepID=UPI00261F4EEE|nr:thiol:disulfide interchange protein DsbA/DsbL [Pseudoxanthomonas sp.]WDS34677.1 MAG: thiol:disulfide interchange protein DsbA/DsbL [Pseudoxanthomonas sp.]
MRALRVLCVCLMLPIFAACSQSDAPRPQSVPAKVAAQPVSDEPVKTSVLAPATKDAAVAEAEIPNTNKIIPLRGPAPVAGNDYVSIPDGQPFEPADGKIEVVEFFNYICPFCATYSPMFHDWKTRLPADVRITYVPADFRPDFAVYARAYYAADVLGIAQKSHDAVYKAVHTDGTLPGEGQPIDENKISQFYSQYGVTAEQFSSTMKSFGVSARMQKGRQFAMHGSINQTPSIVVDGKYLVKGKSWEDSLRIADHLIAQERSSQSAN